MTAASPETGSVCPTFVLTEPTIIGTFCGWLLPKVLAIASASMGSPAGVPERDVKHVWHKIAGN